MQQKKVNIKEISFCRCGGTLISNRHVLTSAYCTRNKSPASIEVILGEHRIDDNIVTRASVGNILIDPLHYSNSTHTLKYNFAILTLTTEVNLTPQVFPICLPRDPEQDYAGQLATATGWGWLDYDDPSSSPPTLQEVNVTVNTHEECQNAYHNDKIEK